MAEYNPILSAPQGANKKPKRVGRGSSSGLGRVRNLPEGTNSNSRLPINRKMVWPMRVHPERVREGYLREVRKILGAYPEFEK